MTRGYLSLRINKANPAHHLYLNSGGRSAGNYWVAYTLHFDDRKRRVRRSLGTKCLAEAIRRRDALFARIHLHGEEVPERRRALPSGVRNRTQKIRAADELVAQCQRLTATPVDSGDEGRRQWTTAASLYDRAGQAYRRAGLGLRAIAAWNEAARCYAALGHADRRRLFERRVASVRIFHDEA